MRLVFRNKATGVTYPVVRIDPKDAKERKIVLQGEHGEFVEPFSKERFEKMGYELVQEPDDEEAA